MTIKQRKQMINIKNVFTHSFPRDRTTSLEILTAVEILFYNYFFRTLNWFSSDLSDIQSDNNN